MGGTFDPIHIGHLLIAEAAWEELKLDKVLFMPSGNPPHKQMREGATNSERLEITRLAIKDNPHFELSSFEMERAESRTYTYKTLELIHGMHPDWDQYFILGGDSLVDFHGWREPQRICNACTLAVAIRNHMPMHAFDMEIRALKLHYNARVQKLHTGNIDISSSELRARIREGRSIRYFIPADSAAYIEENRIYS
jgi:nicotinate-nucleotide adenylyltransferase